MTPDGHFIIAVDFDKTLIKDNSWPDVDGKPNVHLIEYLNREKRRGSKIILWSCRAGEALEAAVKFCEENGLIFDAINDNIPEIVEAYKSNSRKVSADIYLDDKSKDPDIQNFSFMNQYNMWIEDSLVSNS